MSWILAALPALVAIIVVLALLRRQWELREYARSAQELASAQERGSHQARLQHPEVDLSRCIGCGACVRACPEEGVLSLLHGQAIVVHGARCVGHGRCAEACPVDAIALTLGDLSRRRDLPALTDELEAVGTPGLFLAGEISGFALVRTAVTQGTAVADAVAERRVAAEATTTPGVLDLLVVGAGPAGIACALRARELELDFQVIEQATALGGTVAGYPRAKMVMTQPVDLPLHGPLTQTTYQKEELIALWERLVDEHDLPVRLGVCFGGVTRGPDGVFTVTTSAGPVRARQVCLALGRRGTPRRLGVAGEDLPKVAYSLLDAQSYVDRNVLVVGGGDSAVEAALGLADQPGNTVTLSYRKPAFFRLKARNEARVTKAIADGRLTALLESEVRAITPEAVELQVGAPPARTTTTLPNDDVFIFAGGEAPYGLLEAAGVSFDPADRPPPAELAGRSSGLLGAVTLVTVGAIALAVWAVRHHAYYGLPVEARKGSPLHGWLGPVGQVGLSVSLAACALMVWNLTYLVRRSDRVGRSLPGSLRVWMTSHVFTGLLAPLGILLHAGFAVQSTPGGHALLALGIVVVSGMVGRYLYAFVPRAANGAEVDLAELRTRLASVSADWEREGRRLGATLQDAITKITHAGRWRPGLLLRLGALLTGQIRLRLRLRELRRVAAAEGVPPREVRHAEQLANRAYRLTLLVTHYEEVRAVLASWRFFHRWLALLMVLLAAVHIVAAARFAAIDWSVLPFTGGGAP